MATAPIPTSGPPPHPQGQAQTQGMGAKGEAALAAVTAVRDRLRKFRDTEGHSLNADALEAITASVDELDALLPESPHVGPKL